MLGVSPVGSTFEVQRAAAPLLLEFAELFERTCWVAACQLGLWGGFFTPLGELRV